MLTKIKKLCFVLVFLSAALFLTYCSSPLDNAINALSIEADVTEDFTLPSVDFAGATTVWSVKEGDAIKIENDYAEVTRPSMEDATVVLELKVTTEDGKTKTKEFKIKVQKALAPETIELDLKEVPGTFIADPTAEDVYLLAVGKSVKVGIIVGEGESAAVNWDFRGDAFEIKDGEIKALKPTGTKPVKITAKSVSAFEDKFAEASFKVRAVPANFPGFNPRAALIEAIDEIMGKMPEYVYQNTIFPLVDNPNIGVQYYYENDEPLEGNQYIHVWQETTEEVPGTVDHEEEFKCVVSYLNDKTDFSVIVKVIKSADYLEENEFEYIKKAQEHLKEIFAKYGSEQVEENITVPTVFIAGEEAAEDGKNVVNISFSSTPRNAVLNPLPVVDGEKENEKVLEYVKPNDETIVDFNAYIETQNCSKVMNVKLVAKGHTKEEIMQYIIDEILPRPNTAEGGYELVGANLSLPKEDANKKFPIEIEWASSNEAVLTKEGKFTDPYLANATPVKLTATVKYLGTSTPLERFAFTETKEFEYQVIPPANKAQAICLELSNHLEAPEFYDTVKHFPFSPLNSDGTYQRGEGVEDKNNIIPLPSKIGDLPLKEGEMTEYRDIEIAWSCPEEDLFDADHKLLKQYLRYHEVPLVYTIKHGEDTATGELMINVGIANAKKTIHIGGLMYGVGAAGVTLDYDCMSQLSLHDEPRLKEAKKTILTWGSTYAWGHGEFGGITFWIDNPETGNRHQFFANTGMIMLLDDDYEYDLHPEIGEAGIKFATNDQRQPLNPYAKFNTNWGLLFKNDSSRDIKIPMGCVAGLIKEGQFTKVDGKEIVNGQIDGEDVRWQAKYGRDNSFTFDGYVNGFSTDRNGKVVFGGTRLQDIHDVEPIGDLTEEDYWITIPAGGIGVSFKTQIGNSAVNAVFCQQDAELHFEYYMPYAYSRENPNLDETTGRDPRLYSYVHPFN